MQAGFKSIYEKTSGFAKFFVQGLEESLMQLSNCPKKTQKSPKRGRKMKFCKILLANFEKVLAILRRMVYNVAQRLRRVPSDRRAPLR